MAELIGLDNGKFNVKGYAKGGKQIIFKNRVSKGNSDTLSDGDYNASFRREEYLVGNSASGVNPIEGKAEVENLLTTLVAITQLTEENEIILVYGESVNYYFNREHHKKLHKLLKGTHTIVVQGKSRQITIKEVHIFLEGIGHMFTDFKKRGTGTRFTVDMGGTTVQVLSTINGTPSEKNSFSFPMGMYSIRSEVDERIKKKLSRVLTANEVEDYIEDVCDKRNIEAKEKRGEVLTEEEEIRKEILENARIEEEIIEIVENVIKEQLDELDNQLALRNNFKLDNRREVFFVGGTSVKIKEYIKEHYTKATVLEDGLFSNAKGYYAYGKMMKQQKEK